MIKYELTASHVNNLLIFLDRVEFKGIKELQAINEIMNVLTSPAGQANDQGDDES
ncbi:hypothetical protein [Paenibacillus contaminans]|uniref:hypothetical protein n=1 Tax=Paenibacillus contaminans TaxID=450362 RepID=UPI0013145179|nr:hypothetical protein [Paenibacillus contaminans]